MAALYLPVHHVFHVPRLDADHGGNGLRRARLRIQPNCFRPLLTSQLRLWPISSLLNVAGPSAIFRAVWAVIVDSVERLARRLWPHVLHERSDIKPSLANRNAAPAIPMELLVLGVCAPLEHGVPSWVERMVPKSMRRLRQLATAFCRSHSVHAKQRVSMPVPTQIVLTAPTPSQQRRVTKGAGFHMLILPRMRTFEKIKGVAR